MVVSLYTSRVVLNTLGVEDFGIYNAVGGVVAMFAIISGALSNAVSRYITYGIGQGDKERLKVVFCTSVNIQVVISIIVFVLCEIGGLWFLNYKMSIPSDRLGAANWVLHCSLLTFVVNLISVPYNACIIAHEHMKAYTYISIVDALLKLTVACMLIVSPIDKLIAYSILSLCASLGVRLLYGFYCGRHFEECKYKPIYDKNLFKDMMSFAGWNFLGNATSILNSHGISLLMNVFFGVFVNSARGIASQVESAVHQFVVTFTTAVNPQITKSYSQGDRERMFYLVCKGAKFSYFLLLLFAVPILFETETILTLWLKKVPEHSILFSRLALIGAMVSILGNTSYAACLATGDIKKYSIYVTLIGSMAFFLTWIAYSLGATVECAYMLYIFIYMLLLGVRLVLTKQLTGFPVLKYVREVLGMIVLPTIVAIIIPIFLIFSFPPTIPRFLLVSSTSILWTAVSIYSLGLTKGERKIIISKMNRLISKLRNSY